MAPSSALINPPAAGEQSRTDEEVYGLLTLAGVEVALPIAALREVVPCPTEFADLPASADGLLGAMTLRELVVPVVDLRPRLGVSAERTDEQVVVIIAQEDQTLGLLADGARGITRVAEADLRSVRADDGPLLFSHAFREPALGYVVSVLHVSAVLRLPGVPTVHDSAGASGAPLRMDRRTGPRRTVTLLCCGDHVLGIEVAHVHTTLADAVPQPSVLESGYCQGVTEYTGLEVPVVDPLALLGLGRLPEDRTGAGLVMNLGHGYVVLGLTALADIVEVADADVLSLPSFSVRRPELLAGIADIDGAGQCLVLDGDALHADVELQALATLNTSTGAASGTAASDRGAVAQGEAHPASGPGAGGVYLTYSVGHDVATPLDQVDEIIALPDTRTPTDVGEAVLGVAVHRRAAVPVLCLPTLLGLPRPPITSATCLLLVEVDGDQVGFAVQALRTIDPLVWREDRDGREDSRPVAARATPEVARALRSAPMVGLGEDRRLLRELDLRAVARAVRKQLSGGRTALASAA